MTAAELNARTAALIRRIAIDADTERERCDLRAEILVFLGAGGEGVTVFCARCDLHYPVMYPPGTPVSVQRDLGATVCYGCHHHGLKPYRARHAWRDKTRAEIDEMREKKRARAERNKKWFGHE